MTALGWAMKYTTTTQVQTYATAKTAEAVAWACDGLRPQIGGVHDAMSELMIHAGYAPLRRVGGK